MKVKICGMKYRDNTEAVVRLNPDYIGFIFYPLSKRYAGEDLDQGWVCRLNPSVKRVGVFVNGEKGHIMETCKRYGLSVVQLHGDETPEQCASLRQHLPVWKVFGINDSFDWKGLKDYEDSCDHFLFDTKAITYGGSGQVFDWALLHRYSLKKTFYLSGGLGIENLKQALELKGLPIEGLDLNSRLETSPGRKDTDKVKWVIEAVRKRDL